MSNQVVFPDDAQAWRVGDVVHHGGSAWVVTEVDGRAVRLAADSPQARLSAIRDAHRRWWNGHSSEQKYHEEMLALIEVTVPFDARPA